MQFVFLSVTETWHTVID